MGREKTREGVSNGEGANMGRELAWGREKTSIILHSDCFKHSVPTGVLIFVKLAMY